MKTTVEINGNPIAYIYAGNEKTLIDEPGDFIGDRRQICRYRCTVVRPEHTPEDQQVVVEHDRRLGWQGLLHTITAQLMPMIVETINVDDLNEPDPDRAPAWFIESMRAYWEHGRPPGDFGYAVLCNNLTEAMGRADMHSREALPHICTWMYLNMPTIAWKTPEKVKEWINHQGMEGLYQEVPDETATG